MHTPRFNRLHRQWLISLLLIAIGVRALIPAGFMPSADQPFTLQICPDGFPAQLLQSAHHHHEHGSSQNPEKGSHDPAARAEHCVFAAAAGAGLVAQIAMLLPAIESQAAPQLYFSIPLPELTRHRVQQPRAPPALS